MLKKDKFDCKKVYKFLTANSMSDVFIVFSACFECLTDVITNGNSSNLTKYSIGKEL